MSSGVVAFPTSAPSSPSRSDLSPHEGECAISAVGYADLRRAMPLMETVAEVTPPPKSIW